MLSLKNLNFAQVPKNTHDPLLNKRNKLISRLQDQKALFKDPLYYSVSHRWDVSPDGTRNLVEHKTRVRPWWRQDISGKIHLVVRYGQKLIEFEKGKSAILVSSKDQLPAIFDALITAIQAGELDEALVALGKVRSFRKKVGQISNAA